MHREHTFTVETRGINRRKAGVIVEVHQTRHVCACGFATWWRTNPLIARREANRHALSGQLSVL